MNRGLLALGAGLVLAAVIGLYALLGSDDGAPAARTRSDPRITEADPGKPVANVPPPGVRASVTPPQRDGTGSAVKVTDYMVGGVRIRDHRAGEHARVDVPPAIHPPEGRRIPSQLTSDIAQKVRVTTAECASNLSTAARGTTPRVDGTIMIAIKNRQATVTSATVQLRDVAADAAAPVKQCIEQKSVGAATDAGDEPDLQDYAITLSLRLP